MRFWNGLIGELALWKRLLFEAPLYGLLLFALIGGIGAYQLRRPQFVDVGGIHDTPYLDAFHDPEPDPDIEPNPEQDYRWTRDRVGVEFQGVGRQPVELRLRMQAHRPPNIPSPEAALLIGEEPWLTTVVGPDWHIYHVLMPDSLLAAGDLYFQLETDTFQPSSDARYLGASVDWIELRPIGVGWVGPAWVQIGSLLSVTLLAYLLLRRWGLGPAWTSLLVALGIGILSYLLAFHRHSLTYYTPTLVILLAWGGLLTVLFLPLVERWQVWRGRKPLHARLLWAILLVGLLLRIGGMAYPQFRSSDLTFHAHRAARVASGELFFAELLPDVLLPAPYPPGLYVTLMPAWLLGPELPLLLQIGGVVLDALCGLLLYLLALRLTQQPGLALLALSLQQIAPVTYWIYVWGNYTNLFSRATLLGAILLLCLGCWSSGRRREWLLLTAVFGLVLLGHFADSLLFVTLVLVVAGLGLLRPSRRWVSPVLLGALVVAGAVVLGLYYLVSPGWEALLGLFRAFLAGEGQPETLVNPWKQFLDFVQAPMAFLALPGLLLLYGQVRSRQVSGWRGVLWPGVVLGGVLLTAAIFALGQVLFGFSVRYALFVLPVLALGTAGMLLPLWKRGWAGRLTLGALLGSMLWHALWVWYKAVGFGLR